MTDKDTSDVWWKNVICYSVDVASYADGNRDGWGDLVGLTDRLGCCAISASAASGCCRSTPHPARTAATMSPTTSPSTRGSGRSATSSRWNGQVRPGIPADVLCTHVHGAIETAMRDWAAVRVEEPYERLEQHLDLVLHGALASPVSERDA